MDMCEKLCKNNVFFKLKEMKKLLLRSIVERPKRLQHDTRKTRLVEWGKLGRRNRKRHLATGHVILPSLSAKGRVGGYFFVSRNSQRLLNFILLRDNMWGFITFVVEKS